MADVDVTVVVPVYNTMPYLTRTLDSLVAQSIGPERMHVVAVDDGSTDGSGAELERYAAAHPGLFTVVHQENSGGPAGPCNVGLARATGRYVYFLGADDHLGAEALERMVEKADEWGSDVLCGRMVGTDGRFVSQRLYDEDRAEVPFPSSPLVFAISNTKLFRRSLIEEHGLRYPLDLRVGSDQPFTIAAMLHARRISVLASYECYYAVRREDSTNISYRTTWRERMEDIGEVMAHIAEIVPAGEVRDGILVRHFASELAKLLARHYLELDADDRAAMAEGLRHLLDAYYTDRIAADLTIPQRLAYHLLAADRPVDLEAVLRAEADDQRILLVDGERVQLCYPTHGDPTVPSELFDASDALARRLLRKALGDVELTWVDDVLQVRAPSRFHPDSAPYVRLVVVPAKGPFGAGPTERPRDPNQPPAADPVAIAPDGTVTWSARPLGALPPDRASGYLTLRLRAHAVGYVHGLPVRGGPVPPHRITSREGLRRRTTVVEVGSDRLRRVVIACNAPLEGAAAAERGGARGGHPGRGLRPLLGRVRRRLSSPPPARPAAFEDQRLGPLLRLLEPVLGKDPAPAVAVLGPTGSPLAGAVRTVWPQASVTVVDPAAGESEMHVALAAAGRFAAIVDDAPDAPDAPDAQRHQRLWRTFLHLREGGVLVVADALAGSDEVRDALADAYLAEVSATLRPGLTNATPPPGRPVFDRIQWSDALAGVAAHDGHLVLTSRRRQLAKLRDGAEVVDYLARTGPARGRVVATRPGSVVENPAPVLASESEDAPTYLTRFESPELLVKEYVRPTCSVGQVLSQENVLLPETYRHHLRPRLGNRFTVEVGPRFARVRRPEPATDLPGTWFFLDSEFRGHFGHAMTEQIARLWAWQEAKQRHPDLKALMLVNRHRRSLGEWERTLYGAAGVAREDLVLFDHPVRPELLVAVTPMFSQPNYVHAGIRELYLRMGDRLAADAPPRDYPERIFCSRRHDKRSALNTTEVEEFFAARGFEIVFPEEYPLPEQVQMFRAARDVAGFGGSAMFTLAFVPEPKRVFLVSSETYVAQNEAMIAAVHGHQLNVAWCRPELVGPDGQRVARPLQAPFVFDAAREGEFLRRLLDES